MSELSCRELVQFLMDYLDGALPTDQRERFESHLAKCPPCVCFLKSYSETIKLSQACCEERSGQPAPFPDELVRAILAARPSASDHADGSKDPQ